MNIDDFLKELNSYKYNGNNNFNKKYLEYIDDEILFCPNNHKYLEEIIKKIGLCVYNCKCKNGYCDKIIIIYSQKKTGTTALWSTFNIYLENYKVFHLHNDDDLLKIGLPHIKIKQLISILNIFNKNIWVFNIYRPIYDICISQFINELPVLFQRNIKDMSSLNKESVLIKFLNYRMYYYCGNNNDIFLDLINNKINFEHFDFNLKYLYFQEKNVKYYKLRLCDIEDWPKILTKIFDTNIIIFKTNETSKKDHIGMVYKYLKENCYFDIEFYNLLKNNKYFLFYYNEEEQQKYLIQFNEKIQENIPMYFNNIEIKFCDNIMVKNESLIYDKDIIDSNSPIIFQCKCINCNKKRAIIKKNLLKKHNNNI
jgi:hypothetical protein